MTSRKNLTVILTIIFGIFTINTHARSWDLAVLIGREIEFLAQNQTLIAQAKFMDAVSLSGVAYDENTRTMFLSDLRNKNNMSIFSNDLTDKNFTLKPLHKNQNKSLILTLAFDVETQTLFWSDILQEVIMKMHILPDGSLEEAKVFHNLTSLNPCGIALDVCNRHIYWTNNNNSYSSIERSNLDGSNQTTIINENLYDPLAIAIDHINEKLYWIDDIEGIRIKIERSNLDGSEREYLIQPKRHQPLHLALDNDSIYWNDITERAIWRMPKDGKNESSMIKFRSYHESHPGIAPSGILTRDNVGKIDCKKRSKISTTKTIPPRESSNNLTTSTEEMNEMTTETIKYCLNNGLMNEKEGTCQCKPGFTGTHCETDFCHNYCLQGSCSININGLPICKCNSTFIGPRCETDPCKDYCLHDGQCSVLNEKPVCKCKYSEGSRCEILNNVIEFCEIFCANMEPVPTSVSLNAKCRCTEKNEKGAQLVTIKEEEDEYRTLLPIFGAFIGILALVIIVLSYYVNKFRKRPRIKKRFVVSKGGVTPLTSRPQLPDNQCEITIENCCNMNICETPCFEPKLCATPGTNGSKKEEKNSLLDNMEENSW
ncbi:protein cueball [Apis mellifera caucasica]|uniref:Protein cueball n=1 Tax=Apis mellifera TaxID=7460 RepID=A0A7M7RAX3_APIME|nr:protein cueball [Apis mellifera]KAG6801453.1 protein cueball [Apis mellifera caucasica]KAG9431111.1 protein cueball [Apis mellifera carnica]|eukprot:XP_624777.3 protein cueball [Apis mellifera]